MAIANRLGTEPDWLMACIAFETGRTFSASVINGNGSGAVGLIQFMPSTAQALGTSSKQLAAMSPEAQLSIVERYFRPSKGKLNTLEDVYMTILWPRAIGKPLDYVLFRRSDVLHPRRYMQNAGLDFNKDGVVTKGEASQKVRRQLEAGLLSKNIWVAPDFAES